MSTDETAEPRLAGRDLPGLDLEVIADWFTANVPGATAPRAARLIAGGRSNLTYEIEDAENSYILRRPPVGHVLATAHDMGREYRVMAALSATAVLVPQVHGLCTDDSLLGAHFYVMEKMPGDIYRSRSELEPLGADLVAAMSRELVTTLATLHSVVPQEIGLGDFGRPAGFLARQVSRWSKQLADSATRLLPAAEELGNILSRRVPEESRVAIVHGDYRMDNLLFDGGKLTAVLDWEMATLGDPITDLALLLTYQRLAELPGGSELFDGHSALGFLSADAIVETYTAAARPVPHLDFYVALAHFKLAAIFEGIHHRLISGQTVGEGFDRYGPLVELILQSGLDAIHDVELD